MTACGVAVSDYVNYFLAQQSSTCATWSSLQTVQPATGPFLD